jgi:hypothetical protein
MVDLPSSSQKLMWSQIHLDILKSRIEEFIKSRPVVITSHFKPTRPGFDTVFRIQQQTPPEIILGVGDVIGNMRDAEGRQKSIRIVHTVARPALICSRAGAGLPLDAATRPY